MNQKATPGIIPEERANDRPILHLFLFLPKNCKGSPFAIPLSKEADMSQQVLFWILDKAVLAILIGVVANGMFLLIMSKLRPKIEISPAIALGKSTFKEAFVYRVKVINRTKATLVDVRAQFDIIVNKQTATGEVLVSKDIKLVWPEPISIDKYDKNDKDAKYAYRFVTHEDIETLWNNDNVQFLRFRIYARHSVSGFGTFASKDYRLKRNSIKEGEFSKGDTFEIA